MSTSTITIVTRNPDAVAAYFGFGWHEIERGRSKFNDHIIIAQGPPQHAEWQAMRLGSGMHGARIVNDLAAWSQEWGYVRDSPAWVNRLDGDPIDDDMACHDWQG